MLFKPLKLEVISADDPRLSAYSDYVTSKGKDPHGKTDEGCMCGVNNGRWDQLLTNTSPKDPKRVPVWFHLKQITIEPFNKMNKPNGKIIRIGADKLSSCYKKSTTVPGHAPFNSAGGLSNFPVVLEPGESIISCTCVAPGDRGKSGYAKVSLSYDPKIWAANVLEAATSDKIQNNLTPLRTDFPLSDLCKGHGRYFVLRISKDGSYVLSDLRVSLKSSVNTSLFVRTSAQKWSWYQNDWKKGDLTDSHPKSGATYWILVRSLGENGSGRLEVRCITRSSRLKKSGVKTTKHTVYEEIEMGKSATCTFKAYLLGLGAPKYQKGNAPIIKDRCCNGDIGK